MGRRQRFRNSIFFVVAWLLILSDSQGRETQVPPLRSFFPLSESAARELSLGLKLEDKGLKPGLYYSHPEDGLYRVDVPSAFQQRVAVDLGYLADDSHLQFLYRDAKWLRRGTKKWVREGETLKEVAFKELSGVAGWISMVREDGARVRQLWLVTPSKERWLLLEEADKERTSRVFTNDFPEALIPTVHGALVIAKDWRFNLFLTSGRSFSKVALLDFEGKKHEKVGLEIATTRASTPGGEIRRWPLAYFHAGKNLLVVAGWDDAAGARDSARAPLREGDTTNLYLVDLKTLQAETFLEGVKWPFFIDGPGVYLSPKEGITGSLFFRRIDWERRSAGKRETLSFSRTLAPEFRPDSLYLRDTDSAEENERFVLSSDGKTTRVTIKVPSRVPSRETLHELELHGSPADLVALARIGEVRTDTFSTELNSRLVSALAQSSNSWVALIHDKDDQPRRWIEQLVWAIDHRLAGVPPTLRNLAHAFVVDRALMGTLERRGTRSLQRSGLYTLLKKAAEGKDVLLYLDDWIAGDSKTAMAQWREWRAAFQTCAARRSCLVIIGVQRHLWEQLRKTDSTALKDIPGVTMPPLSTHVLPLAARAELWNACARRKMVFNEGAFKRAYNFGERWREEESDARVRDIVFYERYFKELVDFAERQLSTSSSRELDETIFDQFKVKKEEGLNHWRVEIAASGADRVPIPLWISPTGDRKAALPESFLKAWATTKDLLVSSPRYAHALFRVPGGRDQSHDLFLLSPNFSPTSVLPKYPVHFVQLHADGFFFLAEIDKKLKLGFFKVDRGYSEKVPKATPGKYVVLSEDYLPEDILNGKLGIKYQRGRLRITAFGSTRVFGPEGEEDAELEKEEDR